MRRMRNFPQFTHFACLPFISPGHRFFIKQLQARMSGIINQIYPREAFRVSNCNLAHITICMLVLHREEKRKQMQQLSEDFAPVVQKEMVDTHIGLKSIKYFTRRNHKTKRDEVTVLYLELEHDHHYERVVRLTDMFVRELLKRELVSSEELKSMRINYDHKANLFKAEQHHLTLFRVDGVEDNQVWQQCFEQIKSVFEGVTFGCHLFDISTRNNYRKDTDFYAPLSSTPLKCE